MAAPQVKISEKQKRRTMVLSMVEDLYRMKLSRYQLAKKTGISYQTIQHWVNGKHFPSVRHMKQVYDYYTKEKNAYAQAAA